MNVSAQQQSIFWMVVVLAAVGLDVRGSVSASRQRSEVASCGVIPVFTICTVTPAVVVVTTPYGLALISCTFCKMGALGKKSVVSPCHLSLIHI